MCFAKLYQLPQSLTNLNYSISHIREQTYFFVILIIIIIIVVKYSTKVAATYFCLVKRKRSLHLIASRKNGGQRGTPPVHSLGYVNSTNVIHRLARERKDVFRYVRIKADLDLRALE